LREIAPRIKCLSLQGELAFDGAEFVVRNLLQSIADTDCFILDMHRVSFLNDSAARLLHEARALLAAQEKALVFSRTRGRAVIEDALRHTLPSSDKGFVSFEDNDVAVEWCENRLLQMRDGVARATRSVNGFPLLAGMSDMALAELRASMLTVEYTPGSTIISAGEQSDDRVFFIEDGEVSVVLRLADGSHQRVATLSAGMSFGELAMLGQAARSAFVHADTAVRAHTLSARSLDKLALQRPDIKIAVLKNLSLDLAQKLRQANHLIGALAE
jgi:glutaminase